jgi:FAD:protein FMN transferase
MVATNAAFHQNKININDLTDESAINPKLFKKAMKLMGNRFEISVVGNDQDWANAQIAKAVVEIQRIEAIFTTFNDNSQTNTINRYAGIKPVKVCPEMFDLIQRSIRISTITQGAFDITYGSIDKRLWNFDTHMTELPDPKIAKESIKLINFRNIVLDTERGTVYLKNVGMRLGFGGIGKGYAADRAKQILIASGVKSGIVNASGDLVTWGTQPDGSAWTVGVADPNRQDDTFSFLKVSNMAVATSGNYEKYALIDGKRYSHTIDPHTGFPVSGIKSVTIICPHAELADALATPVMVMGVKAGLNLINQMNHIGCIIIDENNKLFTSNNINLNRT